VIARPVRRTAAGAARPGAFRHAPERFQAGCDINVRIPTCDAT